MFEELAGEHWTFLKRVLAGGNFRCVLDLRKHGVNVGYVSSRASGLGVGDFFARTALQDTQATFD